MAAGSTIRPGGGELCRVLFRIKFNSKEKAGYPYDNSPMESFFASLKKEYFSRKEYATIKDVENDLFYYIEIFYNRKRLHSSLGYMRPVAYRLKEMGLKAGRKKVYIWHKAPLQNSIPVQLTK